MANERNTPAAVIAAAWIIVSIPLTWGIYNTTLSAAKLFTHLQTKPAAQVKTP